MRTTILAGTGSTATYGAIVTLGGFDPATQLPPLNGTSHSLIGTTGTNAGSPTMSGNILGTGNTFIGVQGLSNSARGVYGRSVSSIGVSGEIAATTSGGTPNTSADTIAVFGTNQSTGSNAVGVRGDAPNGTGVLGQSTTGVGVYGATVSGLYGIVGASGSAAGSAGLLGVANGPNAVGFGTIAQGGATFAGYFNGTTVVNGTFAVTGSKSAAVKDAAGDYRLMYCMEAPEAWFEDFGTGTVTAGKAVVKLDPQFIQHIDPQDYHVFVTEHDEHNDLYVTGRTATGFAVAADPTTLAAKGKSAAMVNGTFSWRVVGKRNDVKAERLAKFTMPPMLTAPPALHAPARVSVPDPRAQDVPSGSAPVVPSVPSPAPQGRTAPPASGSTQSGNSPAVQPAPPSRP
jgi:hypothetical protein